MKQDNIIATQGLTNLFAGQLDIDSTDKLCSNAFDGESNKIGFVSPERRYEAPTVARPPQM